MNEESEESVVIYHYPDGNMDFDDDPNCSPGCHQGSHEEGCEWYAWKYESGSA